MRTFTLLAVALFFMTMAFTRIKTLEAENNRLQNNQSILLNENTVITTANQKYKIADSLNAIKISKLELTLQEYGAYRAQDLAYINKLKEKNVNLENIISAQAETMKTVLAKLKDSVIVDTFGLDTQKLKCFDYKSKWTTVNGCLNLESNMAELTIKNKEALRIIETVQYKRFLGFLWKTRRVKNRQLTVVSENPSTEITNCEYIAIRP